MRGVSLIVSEYPGIDCVNAHTLARNTFCGLTPFYTLFLPSFT
jgi:hypothetical protein